MTSHAMRDTSETEARLICGTATKQDVEWLVESLGVLTDERDDARLARDGALSENQRLREALERIEDTMVGHLPNPQQIARGALAGDAE